MSKIQNYKFLKKIQNQISPKLLNPSFWNFICGFMWGTCLFMPNFMILMVIEHPIWPKKPNFGFFGRFLSIFCKKTAVKIQPGIQNFAWRSAWTLRTCMPNLVKLSQVVWAYRRQIAQGVQKCKILRPFFANFDGFFWLFGLLYPTKTLELGLYTY